MANPISPGSAILAVLRHGPAHGTEICKRAAKLTGNSVKIGQASLYTALSRLEQKRLVSRTVVKRERGGRPAHVYELTAKGKARAKDELGLIQALYGKSEPAVLRRKAGKKSGMKTAAARKKSRTAAKANGHKPKAKAGARKKPTEKAKHPKLQAPKAAPVATGMPSMLVGAPS